MRESGRKRGSASETARGSGMTEGRGSVSERMNKNERGDGWEGECEWEDGWEG